MQRDVVIEEEHDIAAGLLHSDIARDGSAGDFGIPDIFEMNLGRTYFCDFRACFARTRRLIHNNEFARGRSLIRDLRTARSRDSQRSLVGMMMLIVWLINFRSKC